MIKNIIFDIGNVLAQFRWKEHIEELGYTGQIAERIAKATVCGPYWNELDRGVIPENEVIESFLKLDPQIKDDILNFLKDPTKLIREYDYSKNWLETMKKKGYNIYILSNFYKSLFEYELEHCSFFGTEDGMVVSYREKLIKPDPRIYQTLLERYGLKANECIFLDDNRANVEAARALGIYGIVVSDYEQANSELNRVLNSTN